MNTANWSISDVANYLRQLGLGQYSQTFVQNDISGLELPYLNDEYLFELGIKSVGHRIKLTRFIKSIKNDEPRFPPLKPKDDDEKDIIHPLSSNVYQQLFIQSDDNNNQQFSNEEMKECNACHRKFHVNVVDYHQKVCQETFNKCKIEFSRRCLNTTDEDILDLLVGKVPSNKIKLDKCNFCGKKFLPKLFDDHQKKCQKKLLEKKQNEISKSNQNNQEAAQKNNYKDEHKQLIELIKQKRMEKKNSTPYSFEVELSE